MTGDLTSETDLLQASLAGSKEAFGTIVKPAKRPRPKPAKYEVFVGYRISLPVKCGMPFLNEERIPGQNWRRA